MFMHLIKQINWVDLLALVIIVRLAHVGFTAGSISEIVKMLGAFLTVFICFHYYVVAGGLLQKIKVPQDFSYILGFLILWGITFFIMWLSRQGLSAIFAVESRIAIDQWFAVVLALLRSLIVVSLVMFVFLLSPLGYLQKRAADSFSRRYVLQIAPGIYRTACHNVVCRLFPEEHVNGAVAQVLSRVGN
ncbi:MAG: CvpA family protein [Elusimicrobia bacterium]|nr:CvpA family protein [Elusimicrobiota bacterium]